MGRHESASWVGLRGEVGMTIFVEKTTSCIYSILVKCLVSLSLFLIHFILWSGLHS